MSAEGNDMVNKCVFTVLILAVIAGIIVFFACGRQKVNCVTGINNLDHYYILEFENMNREDSCMIPVCKDDVFAVNFRIDKGHADLIIAMDGKTPIYKGNDIERGVFDVIVPEDGEYRIIVNAKHASGCIEVYAKKEEEPRTMIIETERLILRPWDESDAESLYEYAKDDRVGPITGWPVHTSVENSREVIKNVLAVSENYAVCLKEDKKAIGCVALSVGTANNLNLPENEGEIGYWIGVPFWGRGLIPEATRKLIHHAFADLHLDTLWCGYFDGNEKSKRCQEKCGFVYHHTNKDIHWKLMDDIRTEHITRLTKEEWKAGFTVRKLEEHETQEALSLAWEVFSEYESPDYSPEGTEEFRKCLHDEKYLAGIEYYGAFDSGMLIGMVGIRKDNCHICFFFVDGSYHRLGIGTRLFERIKAEYPDKTITLNSSPYGLPFYRSLGFHETDAEQTVNGIRFTPMKYQKEGRI